MSIKKTHSEKMLELFGKSLKGEIFKYIDLIVEEKFFELQQNDLSSKLLLTAEEVCDKYNVSKSSLERYVRDGLKFSSRGKGFKRMFEIKDLESFFRISRLNNKIRNNG